MIMPKFSSQVPYDWNTRRKYLDLPFPTSEYEKRSDKIRKEMEKKNLDTLLIFGDAGDPGDLVYVGNFIPFGRACIVLNAKRPPVLVTDAVLHGEPINTYAWMTWIKEYVPIHHSAKEYSQAISRIFHKFRSRRVGIVGTENLPMSIWRELSIDCKVHWEDFWVDFTRIKSVRSNREVTLCKETGRITAQAMKAAVEAIEVGVTESKIAAVANKVMFEEGAHDRSFQTIINSGPKGGVKHSYPTDRKMNRGDLVYLDMGAMLYGYQSDMSRSVVVGGKANDEQKQVLDVVHNAYITLTKMMKPGTRTSAIISKAHELERESKLHAKFGKRMYLGLVVHHAIATSFFEFPSLGLPDTKLERNMSFAFEPMAHILDFGTAVIEDTMLIASNGSESITPFEVVHW
ncbi:MAG: Xaa-Pro peptidase family protein [Thaumarchaeota archaeon]|nr:Xaa-Pro peptidase family protein [Nitrososphaerota archaeon]